MRFQSLDEVQDEPAHPGFMVHGEDDTPGRKGYLIIMEAKPGKEEKLKEFLHDINNGVSKEPLTGPWFALQFSPTTFAIFEAFPHASARHDHDDGPGGQNFFKRTEELHEIFAHPAQLYRVDVLHGKFDVLFGNQVSSA